MKTQIATDRFTCIKVTNNPKHASGILHFTLVRLLASRIYRLRNGLLVTSLIVLIGITLQPDISRAQTGALDFEPQAMSQNCPSGIEIYVNSGEDMIAVWSPLSNGDYHIFRGWNYVTHADKDKYSLDFNIASTGDLGKAVFAPITGRVWSANRPGTAASPNYGNTVLIWDPGSGIVIRLAHLDSFSSVINNSGAGSWLGAGTKIGYIGETGCPGCGTHLHMTTYRNIAVGVRHGNRIATEQSIIDSLSEGRVPSFAQAQKFRLIAPSDNCDLIRFDDGQTIYTNNNGTLYPVTIDVWRSWGLSLDLNPRQGQYDATAGQIPTRVLPAYQRGWYNISSEFAWPRRESVFRGNQYPDTYAFRWGQKHLLNESQFGDQAWHEYRWTEVQSMDQNFVDQIDPRTNRGGGDSLVAVRSDCQWQANQYWWLESKRSSEVTQYYEDNNFIYRRMYWSTDWGNTAEIRHATYKTDQNIRFTAVWVSDWQYWSGWTRVNR